MSIPFISYGNDQLKKLPKVKEGHKIICPDCKKIHKLKCSLDKDGNKSNDLMYYNCGGESYVAAVDGRLILNIKCVGGNLEEDE